ncbi:MAG: hypothetical protein QOJ51_5972 [Acidobacteriaceae bacterium]|jgi:uncharacterized protein|nr:hypothetical protein [Acidobacteriaceae bacterium]MEA2263147.1 hypothetical protein [Acidobacteriaceae bacterium]
MLITVADLRLDPVEFDEHFSVDAIDYGPDIRQVGVLDAKGRADLIEEHRGHKQVVPDIRMRGDYSARFEMPCARCVEAVEHQLEASFDLLYRPIGVDATGAERAISTSETEIGYYNGDGLVLEDVLREQVLLSLPEKALCRADCKGLCPGCGRNLNTEQCSCASTEADPRWSALSDLRSKIKS